MQSPSYAYNASAMGLGGVIRRGDRQTIIPTVASVCLAGAGGEASTSVENYYRDGISFTRAESRVAGYEQRLGQTGGVTRHFTYADVFLTNLKIFDRLKIALMQATVTSTREIQSGAPIRELQPNKSSFSIRLIYRGIEIDGQELEPDIDFELCQAGTYDSFIGMLATRGDILTDEQKILAGLAPAVPADGTGIVPAGGEVLEPLKRPPVTVPLVAFRANAAAKGNKVKVPNFGTARFGNVLLKDDRQRLSLLRLSLDGTWQTTPVQSTELQTFDAIAATSDADDPVDGGSVSSGDSGSNGVPIWD